MKNKKKLNFPFEVGKNKNDSWEKRFEEWRKGDTKSKLAQAWRYRSISRYIKGKLSEDKIAKLKSVGILK